MKWYGLKLFLFFLVSPKLEGFELATSTIEQKPRKCLAERSGLFFTQKLKTGGIYMDNKTTTAGGQRRVKPDCPLIGQNGNSLF